jgi:trehalose 6-phosphate phosphatase
MASTGLPDYASDWAFFLDVDGTLIEIASHPQAVNPTPRMKAIITHLRLNTDGAVALVSGRTIAELDTLFMPLTGLPAAGLHGLERRDAEGRIHLATLTESPLNEAKHELREFTKLNPGTLLEDKGATVALHYRNAPSLASAVQATMNEVLRRLGDDFELKSGKMVVELKPSGRHKGHAVEEFMDELPFRGRTPIFIGDDITDEDGFRVVNRMHGYSIRVGAANHSAARFCIPDVEAVLSWLEHYHSRHGYQGETSIE